MDILKRAMSSGWGMLGRAMNSAIDDAYAPMVKTLEQENELVAKQMTYPTPAKFRGKGLSDEEFSKQAAHYQQQMTKYEDYLGKERADLTNSFSYRAASAVMSADSSIASVLSGRKHWSIGSMIRAPFEQARANPFDLDPKMKSAWDKLSATRSPEEANLLLNDVNPKRAKIMADMDRRKVTPIAQVEMEATIPNAQIHVQDTSLGTIIPTRSSRGTGATMIPGLNVSLSGMSSGGRSAYNGPRRRG